MKVEIIIEAPAQVQQDLMNRLADIFPQHLFAEKAYRFTNGRFTLKLFFETERPDNLLLEIETVVAKIENLNSGASGIDILVRNPACAEPALGSAEHDRFLSPVRDMRIIPWHDSGNAAPAALDILLDPARAFGTGLHPSTRLCLQLLKLVADRDSEKRHAPRSVLDIGCGSGILTIAALRLGAARALAIEIDPGAVQIARRNIGINRLTHSARVVQKSWQDLSGQYDLILANLVPSVLYKAAPAVAKLLKAESLLITAGFSESRNMKVLEMFSRYGLHLLQVSSLDGWGGLLLSAGVAGKKN